MAKKTKQKKRRVPTELLGSGMARGAAKAIKKRKKMLKDM